MLAISTKAPGVLQPSDVQTMSERMQQLDTLTRHVHGLGTQSGGVPVDAMQRIMECVAALMQAAPSTVFSTSVTSEPPLAADGSAVAARAQPERPGSVARAECHPVNYDFHRTRPERHLYMYILSCANSMLRPSRAQHV